MSTHKGDSGHHAHKADTGHKADTSHKADTGAKHSPAVGATGGAPAEVVQAFHALIRGTMPPDVAAAPAGAAHSFLSSMVGAAGHLLTPDLLVKLRPLAEQELTQLVNVIAALISAHANKPGATGK